MKLYRKVTSWKGEENLPGTANSNKELSSVIRNLVEKEMSPVTAWTKKLSP